MSGPEGAQLRSTQIGFGEFEPRVQTTGRKVGNFYSIQGYSAHQYKLLHICHNSVLESRC